MSTPFIITSVKNTADHERKSSFALNLIALRKAKGLSQRDLAKRSGLSNRVIAYYETGESIPPMEKLEKIATVLKVSIAALIDPASSDKTTVNLNTRTIKKILLLEQLPPDEQRKVLDYIKDLIAKQRLSKQLQENQK
jgi:transcriptional regulator with XRE-family HTH domain